MTSEGIAPATSHPHDGVMTTTTVPTVAPRRTAEGRLRAVLAVNAATSLVAGVAGLAAARWWSEELGVDSPGWVRIVSIGLVLFAVDVALVARSRRDVLRRHAATVSVADLTWVAATAVLVAVGAFSTTGAIIAVVMAVGVLDFALLQLRFRSQL